MRLRLLLVALACFSVGWLVGQRPFVFADPPAEKAMRPAPPYPMAGRMGANLFMGSAEYAACCLGIYRGAEARLETMLAAKPLRPAVIMDLDETVFDNTAMQTFLYKSQQEYSDELWDDYEANYPQDVGLVPGALGFIQFAEHHRVKVIFISNRSEKFRKANIAALERLKINVQDIDQRLFLKGESSEKATRREAIAAQFNVLMVFGDNLRDFSEAFQAKKLPATAGVEECRQAIRDRNHQAMAAFAHWGVDWFVLPNPVYGEWEKLVKANPADVLPPTSMKK